MHTPSTLDQVLIKALNSFDDYVFLLDEKGMIVFANDAVIRKLGYTAEEFSGMNVMEVHPVDQRNQAGIIVQNMLAGIESVCPIPLLAKSGDKVPVETKVSTLKLKDRTYILGISRDISVWINSNQMLSQSEEKFKKSFELSSRMKAISDYETGEYIDINEQFTLLTGYERQEVIGKTSIDLQLFKPSMREKLINDLKNGKSVRGEEFEIYFSRKDKTILCSFDAIIFESNHHKYLLTVAEDITEKKKNELALANSEKQLSQVLDGANDGFWDWNIQTGEVVFSTRWAEMIGYRLDEFEHNVKFWEEIVHPDDQQEVFSEIENHLKGKIPRYESEHRVKSKDGSWVWILDRGKIVEWDQENRPLRMAGTHSDITEKKLAEKKLLFRESFEQLINEVATGLINIPLPQIDEQLEVLLKKIGGFIGVDRAYIFLMDPLGIESSNTHEWCRKGISPQKENLQNIPVSSLPWWMAKISAKQSINIEDVSKMSPEASVEKELLESQDIKSIIVVPLINKMGVTGFVGFDAVMEYKQWDSDTELLLRNASIAITNALQRKENESAIENYKNHLEVLIKERTGELEASYKALNESLGKLAKQNDELVKFKTIADKANYPIMLLSSKGLVVYSNRMISRITGCSEQTLANSEFINKFVDHEGPNYNKFSQFIKRRSDITSMEVMIIHLSGKKIPALANASAIFDKEGFLMFFVVSFTDLTERKKGEQELKVLWQAADHSASGIMITDKDHKILYVNQQYVLTCGYSLEELLGKTPKIVRSYKHADEFYLELSQAIQSGQTWKGRIINKKKDGTEYTEDDVISPVRSSDGNITNFIAVTRDITQELRHDQVIQQSEKLRSLGTLAGGIAHDFNNILQIVQAYTELIEYQEKDNTQVSANIKEIIRACTRGKSLVNNILSFSRQAPNEMAPYSFDFLVKEIIHIARPIFPTSVEIILKIEPTGMVLCDPVQIQQIIFNLFNNAIDAMSGRGTITVNLTRIKTREKSSKHDIMLQVTDNGIGMRKEVLDRVFDPFFTTKGVGEGTGLGLATVLGIVKKHNATIKIDSEPNKGTSVDILFTSNSDIINNI